MAPPNNEDLPFKVVFSNSSARTSPRPANRRNSGSGAQASGYSTFRNNLPPLIPPHLQPPRHHSHHPDHAHLTHCPDPQSYVAPAAPSSSSSPAPQPPPGPLPVPQPAAGPITTQAPSAPPSSKLSNPWRACSYSSSVEADDERSTSSAEFDSDSADLIMASTRALGPRPSGQDERALPTPKPRYPGEDTRPTSEKELRGWYTYAFAAEVYMICGISSFIPILLESLARENGVLATDKSTPCGSSSARKPDGGDGGDQCVVYILGAEINTASFTMYTFSISTLLQALLVVSISCAADHGNYRKKLLLTFAVIGSLSVMAYIFVTKDMYILGAVLAIVSNTAFGASFVLLNSFLPLLVRNHPVARQQAAIITPTYSELEEEPALAHGRRGRYDDGEDDPPDATAVLLAEPPRPPADRTSVSMNISTHISARGLAIGYMAALFLQCASIFILIRMHNAGTWAQRVVLFVIGAWWAIFTFPAAAWLRPRPGPPLPDTGKGPGGKRGSNSNGRWAWLGYLSYAWRSLFRTVLLARRLVDIVLFLAAWFLLSDAIATMSNTAVMFAKTTLHMETWALGLINVIATLAGVVGAFAWTALARRLRLQPHHALLAMVGLFELIPLYGLLGYLPFVRAWGVLGLQQPWEMYPLAALYGLVIGGLGAYCRSLFGELIPPGSEAAFYALYAITDKGSSVFGPTVVAAIIDATGDIRPAFWFLAVLISLPAPLIWFVDVDRGKLAGGRLADVIQNLGKAGARGGEGAHQGGSEGGREGFDESEDHDRQDEEARRLFDGFDERVDDA